ncbi:MAG: hypothetical protein IKQ17_12585 [Kiritimatiellae bacterium]|nr:hypothetical protein [Kiritimatiellia bacterium]
MPGKDGEFVPKLDKVVAEGTRSENPTHRVRYWWCTYGHGAEYSRWTLHAFTNFETDRTLKTVFRCGDAQVTDFWTGERRIPSDGALRLAIAPCDTVLLRIDAE